MNLKGDPLRMCQPIGEFRMLARDGVKIELAPATGLLLMLFENSLLGVMRIIYFNRGHVPHVVDGLNPARSRGRLGWGNRSAVGRAIRCWWIRSYSTREHG